MIKKMATTTWHNDNHSWHVEVLIINYRNDHKIFHKLDEKRRFFSHVRDPHLASQARGTTFSDDFFITAFAAANCSNRGQPTFGEILTTSQLLRLHFPP